MRIIPYRTEDDVIEGVVLTFVDFTDVKKAEEVLREQRVVEEARAYLERIVATVREPLVVLDGDLRVVSANHSFFETFGGSPTETAGRALGELGDHAWDIPELTRRLREVSEDGQAR